MNVTERWKKELLFFDGAMGTMLQKQGLKAGELPELWNITREEVHALVDDIFDTYSVILRKADTERFY